MGHNTLIFLRHAETKVDGRLKNSEWELTAKGKKQASNLPNLELLIDVDLIITSYEDKAYYTSLPLSKKLQIEIRREKDLNEIMRDNGKFLENNEYLKTIKLCMKYRNESFNNWETAENALERFFKKIEEIDLKYNCKKILIVAHGVVINLYFAKITNRLNDSYKRARTNTFCDYGIIKDGKIIKDIAKIPE
ncbi:MAG: histidine phosphatase family protein [Promethearchaeota archaeon]|jgi:broad specificity phosphatase PhoE